MFGFLKYFLKEIFYELKYWKECFFHRSLMKYYRSLSILDDEDTISEVVKNHKSLARFGDGEFRWILMSDDVPSFQENSSELRDKLLEVLQTDLENLCLCIPRNFQYYRGMKATSKWFWRNFINVYGESVKLYLDSNKTYGNTNISRFYMDYRNQNGAQKRILNLKKIWNQRNLLIVEGEKTRFGVGNDLFSNVHSIRRILCPSKNAFSRWEDILNCIMKNVKENDLVLLALGPTATVLSYELAKRKIQAVDIGHLDIEYEWYCRRALDKIAIRGKFVNEAKVNKEVVQNDQMYQNSIIAKLELEVKL